MCDKDATENHGNVYGFSLVYSGNFTAGVEMNAYNCARAYIGINPFGFNYALENGEEFNTPEAVLVYSPDGLGDWVENPVRLPNGLKGLADKINKLGMHFGLWFDPAMLYYMPQTWTSDDTDAVERLKIQYGTSIVYPYSAMGAHVSACPNHQIGRTTPFKMRCNVAMLGQFGFELDLNKCTEEEIETAKEAVKKYRGLQKVFHNGECYRQKSPFEEDKKEETEKFSLENRVSSKTPPTYFEKSPYLFWKYGDSFQIYSVTLMSFQRCTRCFVESA